MDEQKTPALITMGSLFDGIGAFPFAAQYYGIEPVWASEILPNSVSVTKRHFPNMAHMGDVTKLRGGDLPPVSVICMGSPCQSFSIAGPRTSFNGKSSLFFEGIRIIREMREATHGKSPDIAIFENVLGVLSIDSGRSYKTIVEAFCETEVPMPESGKWASGYRDVGRLTAQGLYNISNPVAPSEAKPGDLCYFHSTYSSVNPVTHVAIYVGGGMMLSCGNPIQYTSMETAYWQSHFYGFARLPE